VRDRSGRDLGAEGQEFCGQLGHGDVALLGHTLEQELARWVELGVAPAALRLGSQAAGGSVCRHQPHHEGDRDLEVAGGRVTGMARLDKARHPAAQVQRIGLGHRSSPPKRAKMSESRSRYAGKPTIQSEPTLL
jgi:hypothetical protein